MEDEADEPNEEPDVVLSDNTIAGAMVVEKNWAEIETVNDDVDCMEYREEISPFIV